MFVPSCQPRRQIFFPRGEGCGGTLVFYTYVGLVFRFRGWGGGGGGGQYYEFSYVWVFFLQQMNIVRVVVKFLGDLHFCTILRPKLKVDVQNWHIYLIKLQILFGYMSDIFLGWGWGRQYILGPTLHYDSKGKVPPSTRKIP